MGDSIIIIENEGELMGSAKEGDYEISHAQNPYQNEGHNSTATERRVAKEKNENHYHKKTHQRSMTDSGS